MRLMGIDRKFAASIAKYIVILAVIITLLYVCLPNIGDSENKTRAHILATDAGALRQIAVALQQYARDHGGILPNNVRVLVEKGYASQEMLICPSIKRAFRYIPNRRLSDDPEAPVVYPPPELYMSISPRIPVVRVGDIAAEVPNVLFVQPAELAGHLQKTTSKPSATRESGE